MKYVIFYFKYILHVVYPQDSGRKPNKGKLAKKGNMPAAAKLINSEKRSRNRRRNLVAEFRHLFCDVFQHQVEFLFRAEI